MKESAEITLDHGHSSGKLFVLDISGQPCKKMQLKSFRDATKALLRWKFQVQDLLHEPEVLLVSLAHLVARMGWAHAKGLKGTDSYTQNHTSLISPICDMGLGHA